jgi:hypothetical protein
MSGAFANHAPAAAEGAGALVAKAQAIIGAPPLGLIWISTGMQS